MDAKPHLKTTNFAFRFDRKKSCTERESMRQRATQRRERGYLLRFRIGLYFCVYGRGAALEVGEVRDRVSLFLTFCF